MIKVGVIGGAGYTAGELLRILINHPEVEIKYVHSTSNAGNAVSSVHGGLIGDTSLNFSETYDFDSIDALFLCSAHGQSRAFLCENKVPERVKIIDLAQDFRDESDGFVYGLPEINRERIRTANKVANPGCFATAIQLSVLPLAAKGLIEDEIHITAITGSTGAGVKPSSTTHFSWRTDNISVYKSFEHQHLIEIGRTFKSMQEGFDFDVNFVPMRGDFARGIFVSMYINSSLTQDEATELFSDFYASAEFTHYTDKYPDLKQVVNTNKGIVSVKKHGKKLHVVSVIDNLLKGASGQAVQNMNLMFGLDEGCGVRLKPSGF
ncbi:MAG: N-acetyl-gamma-glutamyl-phosphate reductase [Rikenellaceae bacterium]